MRLFLELMWQKDQEERKKDIRGKMSMMYRSMLSRRSIRKRRRKVKGIRQTIRRCSIITKRRLSKCHKHPKQCLCKILRAWVIFSTEHKLLCRNFNLFS